MKNNNGVGKVNLNRDELVSYLEEMINLGLAEDFEENAYYDYLYTGKVKRSDLEKVKCRFKEWHNEVF